MVLCPAPHAKAHLKRGVPNGSIALEAWDTACTSNAGKVGNPFIKTDQLSTKVFALVDGHPTPATNMAKLHHPICKPAHTLTMVLALVNQSLLSGVNFSEAG